MRHTTFCWCTLNPRACHMPYPTVAKSDVCFCSPVLGAVPLARSETSHILLVSAKSHSMPYALLCSTTMWCACFFYTVLGAVPVARCETTFCLFTLTHTACPMHFRALPQCDVSVSATRCLEQCPFLELRHTTFFLCPPITSLWLSASCLFETIPTSWPHHAENILKHKLIPSS